jgi:hypothetical protein
MKPDSMNKTHRASVVLKMTGTKQGDNKMKKIVIPILLLPALILTACSSSSGTQSGSVPSNDPSARGLPVPTQLVIGTFKLEDTDHAVTKEQATELLPLWEVYKDLSSSDTAAQEEIDALIEQIQDTMTPEQTKAIADMQLTQEDVFTLMKDQGIEMSGGPQTSGSQNGNGNNGFTPPDGGGGFPEGGGFAPPDGGGGFQRGNGQGLSPDQIATAQASRGTAGGGFNRVPSAMLDALIQFLQKKAGS